MGDLKNKMDKLLQKARHRAEQNKSGGLRRFLLVMVVGYGIFFSSAIWFPQKEDLIQATPYYQMVTYKEYKLYITQMEYSEKDAAIQTIIEIDNKEVLDEQFEYTAVERSGGSLYVRPVLVEQGYAVLRIEDVPSDWKEISLRVQARNENERTQAKIYTNKNEIAKVAHLPRLSAAVLKEERMKAQIKYDDVQIAGKNSQITELQKQNQRIKERIQGLQGDTYLSETEAQDAKDIISRGETQVNSNEDTISNLQKEIKALEERTKNIAKHLKGGEG